MTRVRPCRGVGRSDERAALRRERTRDVTGKPFGEPESPGDVGACGRGGPSAGSSAPLKARVG